MSDALWNKYIRLASMSNTMFGSSAVPLASPEPLTPPTPKPTIDLDWLMEDVKKIDMAEKDLSSVETHGTLLKELGFTQVATPILSRLEGIQKAKEAFGSVVIISEAKIRNFLAMRAGAPGRVHDVRFIGESAELEITKTNPYGYRETDSYLWNEVPVEHYTAVPPMEVLKKFAEVKAKGVYDSYTIASFSVKHVKVPDPLLLGRFHGSSDRFFIAQWGDDIKLDDII